MGNTLHLCLLGYDSLVCIASGEEKKLIAFVIVACRVLCTVLAYCYIGECLINESTSFGESFYHCKWYNISQEEIKLMHICMMRSSKQMQLTVGKFFVLSLTTFTDVVKTSMAYLSNLYVNFSGVCVVVKVNNYSTSSDYGNFDHHYQDRNCQ
ncbi:odorant receptor 67c-like [Vespa mandarinia]|uniref:odorant receptor 67c-like n=1 Tax=Vespa mandarinia TaxID=7446 RepID=UPI0016133D92|nr:odorant receptor 67c-like [Vespa mandarinia]